MCISVVLSNTESKPLIFSQNSPVSQITKENLNHAPLEEKRKLNENFRYSELRNQPALDTNQRALVLVNMFSLMCQVLVSFSFYFFFPRLFNTALSVIITVIWIPTLLKIPQSLAVTRITLESRNAECAGRL